MSIMNYVLRIKDWIRNNKKEAILLFIILLVGAFFRLYKISEYMTFLGDEGRDVIVVRRLLVNFDPILIGPRTSIGDMYLGPLYYYLIAPALLIANFSPVGPAIMVAIVGIITIFFVWYVARDWFGKIAAFVAAILYAISPVVIIYSRSSWNPNIMPFFTLLCIYSLWQIWHNGKWKWLIVLGVSFAFVLQSHYLGLLLLPTILLIYVLSIYKILNTKYKIEDLIRYSLISLIVFSLLMSPLVIFDARHGWRNFTAIKIFFTQRQTTVSIKPWNAIPKMWPIFKTDFVTRIVAGGNALVGKVTSQILVITTLIYLLFNLSKIRCIFFSKLKESNKDIKFLEGFFLIFTWIIFGLLGMGLYKQHIYDHYFGFMFPGIFLLIGAVSEKICKNFADDGKIFVTAGIVLLVTTNLWNNPLRYPANFQLKRAIEVAKVIEKESKGDKFNLAVLADNNYEDGYQYILEKDNAPVYDIDPLRLNETIAEQLFVVCEIPEEKCDPIHSPKAEVANFGWSKIENKWGIQGVTIYKLVHTK